MHVFRNVASLIEQNNCKHSVRQQQPLGKLCSASVLMPKNLGLVVTMFSICLNLNICNAAMVVASFAYTCRRAVLLHSSLSAPNENMKILLTVKDVLAAVER